MHHQPHHPATHGDYDSNSEFEKLEKPTEFDEDFLGDYQPSPPQTHGGELGSGGHDQGQFDHHHQTHELESEGNDHIRGRLDSGGREGNDRDRSDSGVITPEDEISQPSLTEQMAEYAGRAQEVADEYAHKVSFDFS